MALGDLNYRDYLTPSGGLDFADPALRGAIEQMRQAGNRLLLRNQDYGSPDPFTNPLGLTWALHNLGLTPEEASGVLSRSSGLDPNYLNQTLSGYGPLMGARAEAEGDSIGSFDILKSPEFWGFAGTVGAGTLAPELTGATTGGAASAAELTGAYGGMDAGAIAAASESGALIPAAAGAAGASGGGTAAGTAAGAAAGGGALASLQKVLKNGGTLEDWLKLAGAVGPAALGVYASDKQADAYSDLAGKYFDVGAPSRARFESSFAPGFSMANEPGYKDALDLTTKSFLHKASADFGNPVDSPNAWMQTLKDVNASFAYPALNEYRRLNAGTGGLASFAPAAINAEGSSINAEKGIYDSIGAGAADIFNPRKSLSDLMREFQRARY